MTEKPKTEEPEVITKVNSESESIGTLTKDKSQEKEEELDYKTIPLPDWRGGIPDTDSILRIKIRNSRNFAMTYLLLCERFQKDIIKIRAYDIAKSIRVSTSYAYQILMEFVVLGYLGKQSYKKGRGGTAWFLPIVPLTTFIRPAFIAEARKHVE